MASLAPTPALPRARPYSQGDWSQHTNPLNTLSLTHSALPHSHSVSDGQYTKKGKQGPKAWSTIIYIDILLHNVSELNLTQNFKTSETLELDSVT